MTNFMSQVTNFINQDVSIRRGLTRGFINIRALAKYIQKNLETSASLDAIISAIRRYQSAESHKKDIKDRYNIVASAKVSSRTKMCSVLLKKDAEVRSSLAKLYSKIDFSRNEVLRTLEGSKSIKVIVDHSNLNLVKKLCPNSVLSVEHNLGELSLLYDEDITELPGIFSAVSSELALSDISIRDGLICDSEHIFVVSEDDVVKAVQVMNGICHWSRNIKKQSF